MCETYATSSCWQGKTLATNLQSPMGDLWKEAKWKTYADNDDHRLGYFYLALTIKLCLDRFNT